MNGIEGHLRHNDEIRQKIIRRRGLFAITKKASSFVILLSSPILSPQTEVSSSKLSMAAMEARGQAQAQALLLPSP